MAALRAASSAVWLRGPVDGLGRRAVGHTGEGEALEVLRLADRLIAPPACASRLADTAFALGALDHPVLAPPPAVEEIADGTPVLVSPHLAGQRLADLLGGEPTSGPPLTTSAALFILRELVDATRALHAVGVCHGAIGPGRVLITPDHRVVLLEHAAGAALAAVPDLTPADLWTDHGIAVPTAEGLPRFSPLTDQLQLGLTGLAMLLGRPLEAGDYPGLVEELVTSAEETDLLGARSPIGPMLREWLARMTLVSPNGPFPSLDAAAGDLDILLSDDGGYVAAAPGIRVRPPELAPMSDDEVRAFGLPGPTESRHVSAMPAPTLVPANETPWQSDEAEDPGDPYSADQGADPPEALAAEAADESPARRTAPGGSQASHLEPAPDPTANSERILELAHGLEGSRSKRAASSAGPAATADGALGGVVHGAGPGGRRSWSSRALVSAAGAVILLMAGVAAGAYLARSGVTRAAHLVIESSPPGAAVVLEGKTLGHTPVEVSLPRGGHVLEIQGRHSSQSLSVVVGGGERRTERVTLPEAGAPGTLVISTEPVGTPVTVDGVPRGTAPLSVEVPPGRHVVAAANEAGRATREVDVQTGGWVTVPLMVSGWIEVRSPVPVTATVSGRRLPDGVTRIAVAPGLHRVQFENAEIGLRDMQDVVVEAGRTAEVTVTGTSGVLEVTASVPNAAVWIDGKPAGRAPLTVPLALGPHDVRFVHPEGAELRYEVFVRMGSSFLHGDFGTSARQAPARTSARRR